MPEHVYAAAVTPGSRAAPEWPPAPWRLAAALVAGASTLDEPQRTAAWHAIQRLEQAEPPVWHLPPVSSSPRPGVWATLVEPESTSSPRQLAKVLDLPAALPGMKDVRTKYQRYPVRVVTKEPTAWMDVDVDLVGDELAAMSTAALAVPYVGQATHPGELGVLTPDETGGWIDHTSPDGTCPSRLAEPSDQHERWLPSQQRDALPVRCWRPGMLKVLEEDHARRSRNQPGVADHLKGRTVRYSPARRRDPRSWHPVALLRPTRDVVGTLRALPLEAGAVLPIIRGERLVGLLCDGANTLLQLQRSSPDALSSDDRIHRTAGRFLASAYRWRSATPVVAHPDSRIARVQAEQDLSRHGAVSQLRVQPAPCVSQPVRGMSTWHVDVTFSEPVRGPLRIGEGADSGAGVLMANDAAEES